jgi:hypothetical protein
MAERVERFMGPISSSLRPEADGQWVRYADYEKLKAERERDRERVLEEVREGLEKEVERSRQFVIYGANITQLQGEPLTEREMTEGLIVVNRGVITRTLVALHPDQSKGERE